MKSELQLCSISSLPTVWSNSERLDGEKSDPFVCPKCGVTSAITKKDWRLLSREEFEAASRV